jgi:sulfhydrogenase subunit beta (sulfur reductase)
MAVRQNSHPPVILHRTEFQALLDILQSRGYTTIGPTIRGDAVVYDEIASADDFPIGWIDRQDRGKYRLARHKKKMLFACTVGPHSWKRFLYPVEQTVYEAQRTGKKIALLEREEEIPKQAFVGVRSCELHAIAIQDKILTEGTYVDPLYVRRRENTFIVAVNCVRAGGNCFCVSMNTGPRATSGYDLALTEIADDDGHYFVVDIGTDKGAEIMSHVPHDSAGRVEIESADKAIANAASRMGREIDTSGLPELLARNFDNPEWESVGVRCLTCGNCTLVCPTCFCSNIFDTTDLSGDAMQRMRRWDTCFSVEFSYIHGGSVRNSPMSRYRQWMMHKLSYWHDQFGTSGCVGCGRCITWCPVGIDITEEARTIRKSE